MRTTRGQAWSMDIMLAIILFLGTISLIYLFVARDSGATADELEEEAPVVFDAVTRDPNVTVLDDEQINDTKLEELLERDYEELKQQLRLENDFCIYFEDEEGNIIQINNTHFGIGSDNITVAGIACG